MNGNNKKYIGGCPCNCLSEQETFFLTKHKQNLLRINITIQ